MRSNREVKIGQRFTKVALVSLVWEVDEVKLGPGGINHCHMRDVGDPTRTILISEQAVRNKRLFKPMQDPW